MLKNAKQVKKMLGCTDDNNRAVMCMQRGIVLCDTLLRTTGCKTKK
jgi:hypothetical protein